MLPPTLAYELQLIGEGTKPSNRRRPIPSHCTGQCDLIPPFREARGLGWSASGLTSFNWSLSSPRGGRCGEATLPPASAHEPWLSGVDVESSDRRCPIPWYCIGRCGLSLPSREG
jgi:hypothetical protein